MGLRATGQGERMLFRDAWEFGQYFAYKLIIQKKNRQAWDSLKVFRKKVDARGWGREEGEEKEKFLWALI